MEEKFLEAHYPENSREKEIEKLLSFIKKGESVQLISLPGGGRSQVLGLLAYNKSVRNYHLSENAPFYHFVMVDFTEIKNKPSSEIIKLLLLQIVASLEDRPLHDVYEKAKILMKEALLTADELFILQTLKKVLDMVVFEHHLHIVFLFDHFDTYIPMLSSSFFSTLRSLRLHTKEKCSIIFSLYKPLEYFLEKNIYADFAEYVEEHIVYLPFLDIPSISYRMHTIEEILHKTLSQEEKKDILSQTGGFSKLTILATQSLLTDEKNTDSNTFFLSQHHIRKALDAIWQSLNPAEQTHFLKDLYPSVLADEHTQYLSAIGLMDERSITMPLFNEYVKEQKQKRSEEKQLLLLDTDTNTIKKGDHVISDSLTATEFRLLSFFLTHPDTILERNTIISGVWSENKTVLGVTDQALDQLIFRLRKKIEDDPNNPTHIQTVKGRGFLFSS